VERLRAPERTFSSAYLPVEFGFSRIHLAKIMQRIARFMPKDRRVFH
jgi:hypothetical protein